MTPAYDLRCQRCGAGFTARRPQAKFCSVQCAKAASRARFTRMPKAVWVVLTRGANSEVRGVYANDKDVEMYQLHPALFVVTKQPVQ